MNASPSPPADLLAAAIHERWRRGPGAKGTQLDRPFSELSAEDRRPSLASARGAQRVLASAGLALVPAAGAPAQSPAQLIEARLEILAEAEHQRWMAERASQGWRYGEPRDDERKLHPSMKPYADLPESEKAKDRDTVKAYVEAAAEAGFKVAERAPGA